MNFFEVWQVGRNKCEWDRKVKFLGVRFNKTCPPSFVFRCQKGAKVWWISLGSIESMTVDQARDLADRMAVLAREGKDPRTCIDPSRPTKSITLGQLAVEYLERHSKEYKQSYKWDKQRMTYLKPLWDRSLSSLSRRDIEDLHRSIGKRGKTTANRVLEQLRRMINVAIDWGYLPREHYNPAKGFRRYPEFPDKKFVHDTQMPKLLQVMNDFPDKQAVIAIKLALVTGLRLTSLQSLRWTDFNLDARILHLPGNRNKNGEDHIFPLTEDIMEFLGTIRQKDGNPYLFPGRFNGTHRHHIDDKWREIRLLAGLGNLRFHSATRRTLGSWLIKQTGSLSLVGQVLNQTNQHVTKIYSIYQDEHVKQEMDTYTRKLKDMGW